MPQIRVLLGHQQGQVFALGKERTIIGRHPNSHIVLHPDSAASRQHAEVYAESGRWWLRDLGSVNGTEVNGRRAGDEELTDRDEIVIGDNVFVFESTHDDSAAIAEAASHANGGTQEGVQNQPRTQALVHSMKSRVKLLEFEIGKVVVGHTDVIRDLLMAVVGRGHVFLRGMPGLAKTTLVRAIADALQLKFTRIRCAPELTPEDIAGTGGEGPDAQFVRGPVFSQVVLAEEIHRLSEKAQTVLLDAVQDGEINAGGRVRPMDDPFLVVATETPQAEAGTHPFPKSQLDRFIVCVSLNFPSEAEEEQIIKAATAPGRSCVNHVLTAREILMLQAAARDLPASDHVVKYAVRLVRATRPADGRAPDFIKKYIYSGAGPRGAHFLIMAAKANAVISGRLQVSVDDVKAVARHVLRHRITTNFAGESAGVDAEGLIGRLLEATAEEE